MYICESHIVESNIKKLIFRKIYEVFVLFVVQILFV